MLIVPLEPQLSERSARRQWVVAFQSSLGNGGNLIK
jgi:hypothetical protein